MSDRVLKNSSRPLAVAKDFDPREPRDRLGRWTRTPGSGIPTEADLPDPLAGSLPSLPYVEPPRPEGKTGGRAGGWSAFGMTNTALGDAVERALVEQRGLANLHPDKRQAPLDVRDGDRAFEVKAVTTAAAEYKAKPKGREVESKRAEARRLGLRPAMMIVVVSADGVGRVYWKEGIGAYRVSPRMHYAGTVRVDLQA